MTQSPLTCSLVIHLNTKNYKITFDFRSGNNIHQQMTSEKKGIEQVDEYKYLGAIIDAKLSWNPNIDVIYTKVLQ